MGFLYFRSPAANTLCVDSKVANLNLATIGISYSCWLLSFILVSIFSSTAFAAAAVAECGFQTRTQTYYGTPANSTTPGAYVTEHFSSAFPTGLLVGCSGGYTLKLTSAAALTTFLPSPAGATEVLNASYVDPVKPKSNPTNNDPNTYASDFAGQVVALTLSVAFDLADPTFSSADTPLKDAFITSGTFTGKTVAFVLSQANLALGGCTTQYSISQLNTIIKAINEGYDNRQLSTLLSCSAVCNVAPPTVTGALTYCQGAAANPLSASVTLANGATLRIYTAATGGTALLNDFQPSTATASQTVYYVAQVIGSCESERTALTVDVIDPSAVPTVASPITYCLGSGASPLLSSVTAASGATINLYATATGGTPLAKDFRPSTAAVSSITYYASQLVGSCESARTPFLVNVVTAPSSPTITSSLVVSTSNIAAWGDSFTDANSGQYPSALTQLSGRIIANLGIGGQNSGQIANRMIADSHKRTWPAIIWAGRNDPRDQVAETEANIAAMVANLTHTNYLIVSVFNGSGEGKGTYAYQQIMTLNSDLARIYGNHYVDLRSYMVAQYNSSSSQDVADHTADVPPTSLRKDFLHPNAAGSALIAKYLYANLNQLLNGGVVVRYCQGAQALPLANAFNPVGTGATLRFYPDASATTPLGAGSSYAPSTSPLSSSVYYVAQGVGGCESNRIPLQVEVTDCSSTATARPNTFNSIDSDSVLAASRTESTLAVYPNPFMIEATVEFSFPAEQSYTIDLYDGIGQLVKNVSYGTAAAGQQYSCPINSAALHSGLYIVRLTAGRTNKTFHLTLTK